MRIGAAAAIAHQLVVKLHRNGCISRIDHFVAHANGVAAAFEGIGFDEFDVADRRRLEAHFQRILAIGQSAFG